MAKNYKKALLNDFFDKLQGTKQLNPRDQAELKELRDLVEDKDTEIPNNQQGQAEVVGCIYSFLSHHQSLLTEENLDLLDQFADKHFDRPTPEAKITPQSKRRSK